MIIKSHSAGKTGLHSGGGSSLPMVMVAVFLVAILIASLMMTTSAAIRTMQLAQENGRATHILLEKTEALRLYTWSQINTDGFIPGSFTEYFNPQDTNSLRYSGTISITTSPMVNSYSNAMKMVVISLAWESHSRTNHRTFTTLVAKYGLQDYIL